MAMFASRELWGSWHIVPKDELLASNRPNRKANASNACVRFVCVAAGRGFPPDRREAICNICNNSRLGAFLACRQGLSRVLVSPAISILREENHGISVALVA